MGGGREVQPEGVGLPHRKTQFCTIFREFVISLQEIDILSTSTVALDSNLRKIIDPACK